MRNFKFTGLFTGLIGMMFITVIVPGCRKDNSALDKATVAVTDVTSGGSDVVLTPFGYMNKSNVHAIEEGYDLSLLGGRLTKVESKTGKIVEDYGGVQEQREGNIFMPANGSGSNGILPFTSGWIAWTFWQNPDTSAAKTVTYFQTNWSVPTAPTAQDSQTIFLFNGMQNLPTTGTIYIIQPVLQWGVSGAGGGKYWSITNWYVSNNGISFHGKLSKVTAKQNLQGVITLVGSSDSGYTYTSNFTGFPDSVNLRVQNSPKMTWLTEAMESYRLSVPGTMYPPDTLVRMTNIGILQGAVHPTITWTPQQGSAGSAQKAVVVSNATANNGEVDIYFR